jgi:hypothetical protein
MERVVRAFAAAVAVFLAVVVPASAALAQTDPDPSVSPAPETPAVDPATSPPVSLPPGIPTVDPPIDPSDPNAAELPPPPPLDDPSPKVAVVMAQLHVLDVQKMFDQSQGVLEAAKRDEATTRSARDIAQRDRDAKRQVLTDLATDAYVNGGVEDIGIEPTMSEYLPEESARLLTTNAVDRNVTRLKEAEDRLQATERILANAVARSASAQAVRDAAQAALDEATLAVSEARRLTNAKDVSPTVLGDPVLTAEELVGWYKAQGITGYAGAVDITKLAGFYIEEGTAEKIRGDVAFAQSIVETGAFTSPLTTHNNFAGIGACDSCPTGFDFPSPQLGVRAQAQLLHAYADKTLRMFSLAHPAIGSNPDQLGVRGCCPTWNKLTGTWATDPNYGPKLMTVYLSMLQYAFTERTKPPPESPAGTGTGPGPLPAIAGA